MKKYNYFLIIIFSVILAIPSLDNIFNFSPIKELFEKRILSSKPQTPSNLQELKKYPQVFENFYNDNFGFRKTLIHLNSWMMDNVFNQSPSDRAVIGKNGWLYFDNYNSLADAQGKIIYDSKILENGVRNLVKNWQELKKNNIDYVLVIAADKSTIYPEFLPDYIKPQAENRRLDQFLTVLKKTSPNFPVLDLREAVLEAKTKEAHEIYYKTDTHWNQLGSYAGYVAIINFLARNHPGLKIIPRDEFTLISGVKSDGDVADIMNLKLNYDIEYSLIPKTPFQFSEIKINDAERKQFHKPFFFTNKNQNLPILFSYKDSFSDGLMNFLPENFSKSYFTNEFPCQINLQIIQKYHADIVIQQMWEGRVEEVLKSCKMEVKSTIYN